VLCMVGGVCAAGEISLRSHFTAFWRGGVVCWCYGGPRTRCEAQATQNCDRTNEKSVYNVVAENLPVENNLPTRP